jgi:hypothetical protein
MLRGTQSPSRPSALLAILALLALAAAFAACGREAPSGLTDLSQPRFKGKPAPNPITVDDFNPKDGEQGQTFPMTVTGTGFGSGAKVVFVLDGEDVSTISTTTTSVDPTTLTADISIDVEAAVSSDYEVAVAMRRGSRGVATEKFEVKLKGQDIPLSITLQDGGSYGLVSDAQGTYVDGEDPGLSAVVQAGGNLAFWTRESRYRTVRIFLGDPIEILDASLLPDDPTSWETVGAHAWIVTQDPSFPNVGFLKPIPDPLPFYVTWNAEGTTWSLNYGSTCEAANGAWDEPGHFATIQTTPTGWTLATGNAWLCRMVTRRGKDKKEHPSPWTTVGRFDVPTHMTLEKLSGP